MRHVEEPFGDALVLRMAVRDSSNGVVGEP